MKNSYLATIEHVGEPADIACSCSACDWKGNADDLCEIESAVLTPGDPSPAGRCPECDSLAYVDEAVGEPAPAGEFTAAHIDRLLGLADQFLEDWEQNEGKNDPECAERRCEYDAIRPLLVEAPALLDALADTRECLANWVEIAEDHDKRDSDQQALDTSAELLRRYGREVP